MKVAERAGVESAPAIPQARPHIPLEDREFLMRSFEEILTTKTLINGHFTEEFERETARSVGVRHAVAMNSCTSALAAILEYIDVKYKKVLVPVNTFIATSNAVILAGGTPVLIDIGEDLQMDMEKMIDAVDDDTRAVIIVHIAGYIHPRIDDIRQFCNRRGIYLVEDAAHAHGASLRGRQAGSFGIAGAFSYYASKVITTGVGGMLVTDDAPLASRARSLRFHGEDTVRGIQNRIGSDHLMTEFQAAMGLAQLRRLPRLIGRRMEIARMYDASFGSLKNVRLFLPRPGAACSYYKYPVRLADPLEKQHVKERLEADGISTGNAYWPPIHLQPAYREKFGHGAGDFPIAEEVLRSVVTLPLFAGMTSGEVRRVIEGFQRAVEE